MQERHDQEESTMLPMALHRMHHRAKAPATTSRGTSGQDMQMVIGSDEAYFRGDSAICTFQTTQNTAPVSALFFCRSRSSVSRGLLAGWHESLITGMDDGVCQRHIQSPDLCDITFAQLCRDFCNETKRQAWERWSF